MDGEAVPQIMEARLEVRPVATLEADAIANDPEVAFRGLARDGFPMARWKLRSSLAEESKRIPKERW